MLDRRRLALLAIATLLVAAGGIYLFTPGLAAVPFLDGADSSLESAVGQERTTIAFLDENGTTLANANVAVSDTYAERYTGLSDTEELGPNEGMLFIHPSEGNHTYVMRDMAFPIDIVFVDANGTITTIHHAELPAEGEELRGYSGRGKYVVELPYGFTNHTNIDVGDTVRIPEPHRNAEG